MLIERLSIWKDILWRGWYRVGIIVWGVISTYDTISSQVLPDNHLPAISNVFWWWDWKIWLILLLVLLLFGALEGAYRKVKSLQIALKQEQQRITSQPFDITYLIPKNKYAERSFPGASQEERFPESLTVSVGQYYLLHLLKTQTDIELDPIILHFDGTEENKPKVLGTDNLFKVETINNGTQFRNWHGEIWPTDRSWPRFIHAGDAFLISHRIETKGQWCGTIFLDVKIRNGPSLVKKLLFSVSIDATKDEIAFLKKGNEGE